MSSMDRAEPGEDRPEPVSDEAQDARRSRCRHRECTSTLPARAPPLGASPRPLGRPALLPATRAARARRARPAREVRRRPPGSRWPSCEPSVTELGADQERLDRQVDMLTSRMAAIAVAAQLRSGRVLPRPGGDGERDGFPRPAAAHFRGSGARDHGGPRANRRRADRTCGSAVVRRRGALRRCFGGSRQPRPPSTRS